jgi:cytochrome bd ubiquinol oxidase subunit II
VSHTVFEKWFAMPQFVALLPIPVACAVAFFAAFHVISRPRVVAAGYGWIVFASTLLIFVLAFLGLAYSLYPYIIIDRLTIWQAAAAPNSLLFIFVGVAITLPAIIVYTVYMYRVFWGRATELSYGDNSASPP